MAEIQIPVDLGFTEFVTTLLREVLSSIVTSQQEQEERLAELAAAATMPAEEFAALHVADDDVDAYLAQHFPPPDGERPHGAVSGAPYRPAGEGEPEDPPFEALLGVRLTASDHNADRGTLLGRGAAKLRAAARRQLAGQGQETARLLLERGVPRVIVDAGRISAKLTFEALQYREDTEVETAVEEARGAASAELRAIRSPLLSGQDIVMGGRLTDLSARTVLPQVLRDVRMRVRPADDRRPETGTSRTNVYGEVELTFKTVT